MSDIPIANLLLAVFSFIGCIGFLVGLAYSLKNNQLTKYASSTWFIFCGAMGFACLWALVAGLGYMHPWLGFDPMVLQAIDHIFLACFSSLLIAVTYVSFSGDVKLM